MYQNQRSASFSTLFETPGGKAWEDLFEGFSGFWGSAVWRLLYMAIVVIKQATFPGSSSCYRRVRVKTATASGNAWLGEQNFMEGSALRRSDS